MPTSQPWWLTAFIGPSVTAIFTLLVAWAAISFDRRKTVNQELTKKRIAIYDMMAPNINDLLCFVLTVGRWKTLEPPTMVGIKRDLDHSIHIYGPLFSHRLTQRYHSFINSVFATYQGAGLPAKLRVRLPRMKRAWSGDWRSEWDECVAAPEDASNVQIVRQRYYELMDQFAVELGARRTAWLVRRRRARESR